MKRGLLASAISATPGVPATNIVRNRFPAANGLAAQTIALLERLLHRVVRGRLRARQ